MDLALSFNRRMLGSDWPERDWESIRQKHRWLQNTSRPTGDPNCPPKIIRAKAAQRAIDLRASTMEEGGVPKLEEDDDNEEGCSQDDKEYDDDLSNEDENDDGDEGGAGDAEDAVVEFEEILQRRPTHDRTLS